MTPRPIRVSTLRWNAETDSYDRLDHDIDLNEYPGCNDPSFGATVAFPYRINDSPQELRATVCQLDRYLCDARARSATLSAAVRRAADALEAGDVAGAQRILADARRV